jgi:molybdate transport system regulatory protein
MAKKLPNKTLAPRFRVMRGKDVALGPGKADLLEQLEKTGSLNQAAEQMGMSYMRGWTLLKTMNRCFREPLVESSRGGAGGGGAKLTDAGRRVLGLYRDLEAAAAHATKDSWKQLEALLDD